VLKKVGVVASIILSLLLGAEPPPPPDLPSSGTPVVTIAAPHEFQVAREPEEHEHKATHDPGPQLPPGGGYNATMSQVNAGAEALIRGALPHSVAPRLGGELVVLLVFGCALWVASRGLGGREQVAPGRP